MADCSGTPFNFQPEFNTAKAGNINSWGADQVNISTEFETGHWEACTSLSDQISPNPFDPNDTSPACTTSARVRTRTPARPDSTTPEAGDALCYLPGDTHPGYAGPGTSTDPDRMTGCQDNLFQNGDLDFDGTPYWTEWPTGLSRTIYPSSFLESVPHHERSAVPPVLLPDRRRAERVDLRLGNTLPAGRYLGRLHRAAAGTGRVLPVLEPGPGRIGACSLEFGNVSPGLGVNTFGKDAQYGTNQFATLGYPSSSGRRTTTPARALQLASEPLST